MGDSGSYSAIQAALAFASTSRAEVIAEGVETPDVADKLRALGIKLGQGYLLGLPAPAQEHAQVQRMSRVRQQPNQKPAAPEN
jgi:EAL domain-containing protein (putative c-di-GMP-specific phosphodiesterase class I)